MPEVISSCSLSKVTSPRPATLTPALAD
jgi:hypothetical protein